VGVTPSAGSKTLRCENLSLVTDHNQITRHLLECIFTHLLQTRGPLMPLGSDRVGGGSGGVTSSAFNAQASAMESAFGGDDRTAHSSKDETTVLNIYKSSSDASEGGLSIADAIKQARSLGLSAEVVQRCTDKLMMEGLIYSTVDDTHFCESGAGAARPQRAAFSPPSPLPLQAPRKGQHTVLFYLELGLAVTVYFFELFIYR
jgi:Replication protein A C terminal